MMKLIISLIIFSSYLFSIATHPLSMGFMLLIINLLTSIMLRFFTKSNWIPLTIFLVTAGGLMIIFMYSTSISSNELFSYINVNNIFMCILSMYMITTLNQSFYITDNFNSTDQFNCEFLSLYSPIYSKTTIFMFMFLFMTLFIIIKMMKCIKGPLRKKY
uniref:NADH dehydrogenase subunit 6 n=1 Tax=Pseudophacopteron sp. DMP-2018 TaxID=2908812 RepID=A0A344A2P4_9HEMI|nr:NADH dehydrogenase subunit 6 [Pseudophacopteron sp. DMP-2018]